MCDFGGLDNLVANTTYLKAQKTDQSELRKQRRSLTLRKHSKSSPIRASVGTDYESLCELQPIGRKLFRQFLLAAKPQYAAAAEFLEELSYWGLAEPEARDEAKQSIYTKFFQADSKFFLSYLTGDVAERCKAVSDKNLEEVMLGKVREATRNFLKGKPFSEYQKSPFFEKFLQWKEFEKQQKISDKYFYEFRILGKGGFGEVCAVQVKLTGQTYACKKLVKRCLKKKAGEKMALLEKQILEKVNSLFIVNLVYAYDNKTHLCLVMNLMTGGDLKFHIYELGERGIRMERVVYYTAQITTGILHLHSMDIVYRDMKPENVLLDSQGQCRLSDLGLAVELPRGKTICQKAGTTVYMAPELLRQDYYCTSVDWWALGCSIYEMVAARLPFKDYREKVQKDEVIRRILEDDCKFEHKRFDAPAKDIISLFLKKRVEKRLGCRGDDPRNHKFFQNINFHRLEAGLVDPPWVPRSNVVYAKDTDEFRHSSEVDGVKLDAKDEKFYKEFSTGVVSIRWQKEIIDSGLFDELNDPNREESVDAHDYEALWQSRAVFFKNWVKTPKNTEIIQKSRWEKGVPGVHQTRGFASPGGSPDPGLRQTRGFARPGGSPDPGVHQTRGFARPGGSPDPGVRQTQGFARPGGSPVPGVRQTRGFASPGGSPDPGVRQTQGFASPGGSPVPGVRQSRRFTRPGASPDPGLRQTQGFTRPKGSPDLGVRQTQGFTRPGGSAVPGLRQSRGFARPGASPDPGLRQTRGFARPGGSPNPRVRQTRGFASPGGSPDPGVRQTQGFASPGGSPVPGVRQTQGFTRPKGSPDLGVRQTRGFAKPKGSPVPGVRQSRGFASPGGSPDPGLRQTRGFARPKGSPNPRVRQSRGFASPGGLPVPAVRQTRGFARPGASPDPRVHQTWGFARPRGSPDPGVHQTQRFTRPRGSPDPGVHQTQRFTSPGPGSADQIH
ncbi:rhodopsin kinase grk7-b [Diretmus argenteus]